MFPCSGLKSTAKNRRQKLRKLIEAIVIVSQTKIAQKRWHPVQLEPAHNGKISLRSPLSNVMGFAFFAGKIIVISL